jgi:hypothetical protein
VTRPAAIFVLPVLTLALAVGACGSPTEPNTKRVLGRIDPSLSSRPVVWAPAEARAGVAFAVTVTTVGFGCTTAEGGTVESQGDLARIVPYDRVPGAGHDTFCDPGVVILPRDLQVKFLQAGTGHVRVVGLRGSTTAVLDSVDVAVNVLP